MIYGTPLSIIVIDDNLHFLASLRLLLVGLGNEVVTATSGARGLELALNHVPDLLICDLELGGDFDGFDVARMVRQTDALSAVFLVAFSGHSQQGDRTKTLAAGFNRHVMKPANLTDIELLIDETRRHRLRRARVVRGV